MDEAEALCDSIAIMINGRFVVYGSPGHLKSTYGMGYTVVLVCSGDNTSMNQFVAQNMPYMIYKDNVPQKNGSGQVVGTEYEYQVVHNDPRS